jgi:maltodextrin utilization protein YvdJ
MMKNKKAQEEMVGFAIIMIIVFVILLILLMLYLSNSPNQEIIESYEVESFIQAFLQYTTDCRDNIKYLEVSDLIISCKENRKCSDNRNSCEVLNQTLQKMIEESWQVEKESSCKGYEVKIQDASEEIFYIKKGNSTNYYKAGSQRLSKGGEIGVNLKIFY